MRFGKTLIISLLAVFALSAVAASGASAAKPEFKNHSKIKFTSTSGAGTLETTGGAIVQCKKDTDTGEITGAKAGTGKVTFQECYTLGNTADVCTTAGASTGDIETVALDLTLGYASATKGEVGPVGVLFEPEAGKTANLAEFECEVGGSKLSGLAKGSVVGEIGPLNKETTEFTITLKGSKGVQELTKFEGKTIKLEASVNKGPLETASEDTTDDLTTATMTEIEAA